MPSDRVLEEQVVACIVRGFRESRRHVVQRVDGFTLERFRRYLGGSLDALRCHLRTTHTQESAGVIRKCCIHVQFVTLIWYNTFAAAPLFPFMIAVAVLESNFTPMLRSEGSSKQKLMILASAMVLFMKSEKLCCWFKRNRISPSRYPLARSRSMSVTNVESCSSWLSQESSRSDMVSFSLYHVLVVTESATIEQSVRMWMLCIARQMSVSALAKRSRARKLPDRSRLFGEPASPL